MDVAFVKKIVWSVLALVAIQAGLHAQDFQFTTIAGLAGAMGSADGSNSVARFDGPTGVAVDGATNLFIADYFNYTIRKAAPIGTNWVVTTIAGSPGQFGSVDGTNSSARFVNVTGVAVDTRSNLFVADYYNDIIRKVTPSGTNWIVTTIAGTAQASGSADGTNSVARFYFPRGVAVDGSGNVFVADTVNSTIRKITSVGTNWVVTTIAGLAESNGIADGTNSDARFYSPAAVTVDGNGNLFVADYNSELIRKVIHSGTNWIVTTIAGFPYAIGTTDGTNNGARFSSPAGIAAANDGSLFVVDFDGNTVRHLTQDGTNWIVRTVGGSGTMSGSADGIGTNATFYQPDGVAVDRAGNIYISDSGNNTIRRGTLLNSSVSQRPLIQNVTLTNGVISFTWSGTSNALYQVQYLTDLAANNWTNLGGSFSGSTTMSASDFIGTNRQRFYRVELLP
jgi:sugar lactone lactonase YvrE